MRNKIIIISIFALTALLAGCPSNEPPKNGNATPAANNNSAPSPNSNSSITTVPKTPEPKTNDAPTLAPVFKAYCDALTRKDDAAVRKLYAAATLKSLEADMKEEKETSLVKYLETDRVSNKLCEVTNEKISGDVGVAIVRTEGAPNGFAIKFVKEGGEWKLTTDSPDLEGMKKSAPAPAAKPEK